MRDTAPWARSCLYPHLSAAIQRLSQMPVDAGVWMCAVTQNEFNERMNNPDYCQIESRSANRKRKFEKKPKSKRPKLMNDLMKAIARKNLHEALEALAGGADANQTEFDGNTPLMEAVILGQCDLTAMLLQHGAVPNIQNPEGWTALHFAADGHFHEIASQLLQHGAIVDVEDRHGNTPLARTVFSSRGRGEMILLLLASNADRHHANRSGVTPLSLASRIANYDVLHFLK